MIMSYNNCRNPEIAKKIGWRQLPRQDRITKLHCGYDTVSTVNADWIFIHTYASIKTIISYHMNSSIHQLLLDEDPH